MEILIPDLIFGHSFIEKTKPLNPCGLQAIFQTKNSSSPQK
jgi:hypothetical protein